MIDQQGKFPIRLQGGHKWVKARGFEERWVKRAGDFMYGRTVLMALAASACSHAEPARAAAVECASTAPIKAIAGISGDEACAFLREHVQTQLAAGGRMRSVSIDLDLSRRDAAVARIANHPDIAVYVMDREMNRNDLIQLAEAIVMTLTTGSQSN